ncbi:nuclear transport factor 2 family protein [Pseudonocardia benzenivorans]|jgi:carboxymethylenebutenolidase|uniref:Nuclear transport factor 2 family protein n=1 Tax=Pseudonocardia benzenivorans TaxID=228005 RepID=A0ABW3VKA0_9PSEU|nr:nuclear transport factor 2 family protein [Pseudonocardia dioxanivorans]GJF07578.1 hypothetical protein PSD17_65240 [Pseudonocardia sp. D17]
MTMEIQQLMWVIEGLAEDFRTAVYVDRDLDRALALVTEDCEVRHVPAGTGADGRQALAHHLTGEVWPHLPDDLEFRRVTRTSDQRRVVAESAVTFTHDRELPWLLPGIAPTHRRVETTVVSVVTAKHRSRAGRTETWIRSHRSLWDHAGMLAAIGMPPAGIRTTQDLAV